MNVRRIPMRLLYLVIGVLAVMTSVRAAGPVGHDDQKHSGAHSGSQKERAGAFVKAVRESSRRFQDVSVALAEGYVPQFGCVSGSHEGAMGVHLVNFPMVGDPALDLTRPELLVYEPISNGRLRLVAVDYLVLKDAWHETNEASPQLMGQLFHLFESPNRFGLPEFYTLHVWAFKENSQGTFANWNPDVSCDEYTGENP